MAALINLAYRGDASRSGWTTEADFFSGGTRTDPDEIRELIAKPRSMFVVREESGELIGCVHIEARDDLTGYLGMLVADPTRQASGIGSSLMRAAERAAHEVWGVKVMTMSVLEPRGELLAFYERRGYARTGRTEPWPEHLAHLTTRPLHFVWLQKPLP